MKKILFITLVLTTVNMLKLAAQPYLTVNNNTTCSLRILPATALDASCANPLGTSPIIAPSSFQVYDLASICSCSTTGYSWVQVRVASTACGSVTVGGGCIDNQVDVGDVGSGCSAAPYTDCMNVNSCNGCTIVYASFTPLPGGDAQLDLN
jgi:hypothetical protein